MCDVKAPLVVSLEVDMNGHWTLCAADRSFIGVNMFHVLAQVIFRLAAVLALRAAEGHFI